jgi:predicted kinase
MLRRSSMDCVEVGHMKKPIFFMLVGVPAAGKSTWTKKYSEYFSAWVVSTDDVVERIAGLFGITYRDCHNDLFPFAESQAIRNLKTAVQWKSNIIWDQTNLTRKSRARKLALIPDEHYRKIAVLFPKPDDEEWKRRLDSRPGKVIPENVLKGMVERYEQPTLAEGFEKVGFHDINWKDFALI